MKGKGVVLKGEYYEKELSENEKLFYHKIQGEDIAPSFNIEGNILKIKAYDMTLAQYIKENKIEGIQAIEYIDKKIDFLLDKLHSLNIVHIDLSPYNIVINQLNEVRLIDFELSRFIDSLCEEDFDDFKTFLHNFNPRNDNLENSIQDLLDYEHQMWKMDYF